MRSPASPDGPSLNRLAGSMQPSSTMAGAAAPSAHPDPIDLTAGEPGCAPPEEVRAAAAAAAREDRARYGPAAGLATLRGLVAHDLGRREGTARDVDQVIVTAGGKAAIHDALRCIVDPGDEVLVFAPYWPSFLDQITWAGGVPVVVSCDRDYLPDAESLAAAVTTRTRAAIVNHPSNPTGARWDDERISTLSELARRHGWWVIVDQVYGTLTLDGPERPFLARAPELADRTVVVESFSKRFAMTGYRLGAAAGPPPLVRAMTALASSSVTHPSMLSQHAGLAALSLDGAWERELRDVLRRKRDACVEALSDLPGVRVRRPEAGLYVFPDCTAWLRRHGLEHDRSLVDLLRDVAGVKVLPGSAFGAPGHLRVALSATEERLRSGLQRMRGVLGKG